MSKESSSAIRIIVYPGRFADIVEDVFDSDDYIVYENLATDECNPSQHDVKLVNGNPDSDITITYKEVKELVYSRDLEYFKQDDTHSKVDEVIDLILHMLTNKNIDNRECIRLIKKTIC